MFSSLGIEDCGKVFQGIMADKFVSAEAIAEEAQRLMQKNAADIEAITINRAEIQQLVMLAASEGDMAEVAKLSSQFVGMVVPPVLTPEYAQELAKRKLGKQFSEVWAAFVKESGLQDSVIKVSGTRTVQANLEAFAGQTIYKGATLIVCHESLFAGDVTPFVGSGQWLVRYGEKRFRVSAGSKSPLSDGIRAAIAGQSVAQDGGKLVDKLDSLSSAQASVLL